jgi:hypothetical protein
MWSDVCGLRATKCALTLPENSTALDIRGGKGVKDEAVARSIHAAVGKVYVIRRDDPILWAQYIHSGA